MKFGLSTSLVLHAALLGFGLISLSAPPAFEVDDVESLPVDIVTTAEFAEIMRGERKAPAEEKPAPKPTERVDRVEDAKHVGDNTKDLDNAPTPEPKPQPVETASVRKAEPVPVPEPKPELKPVKEAKADPAPVPATEVTPDPTPKAEVTPEPVRESEVAVNPEGESVKLPETAPIPEARPKPPKAQTAKAPKRKDSQVPVREATSSPAAEESEFDADQVAALINRAKASGGGARRSDESAALGNREDSPAKQLSQGELDALRNQLESCWNVPSGARGSSEFTASVKFKVDLLRRLEGEPTIIRSSGNRQFDESVKRAVRICNDRGFALPEGKQAVWADIIVNFDPSQMF